MSTIKNEYCADDFRKRLLSCIEGESVNRFAGRAGLREGAIRQYLSGSVPGIDKAAAIARAASVSLDWLITGYGSMRPEERSSLLIEIPLHSAYLSADPWNSDLVEPLDYVAFSRQWLVRTIGRDSADGLALLEAEGDSMEPTISHEDLLLVDEGDMVLTGNERDKFRRYDGIYAFVQGAVVRVKRLHFKSQALEIISDNAHMYSKEILTDPDLEAFHIIGRVRWIGKYLDR